MMRSRPLSVLAFAALLLAGPAARTASALCTAAQLIALEPGCPNDGVSECFVSGTHTIDSGCTLDFGGRKLTLLGGNNSKLIVGAGVVTIRAGSMSIFGLIDGTSSAPGTRGGMITLQTTGALLVGSTPGRIIAAGSLAGGDIMIRTGTSADIFGQVTVNGIGINSSGGLLDINTGTSMTSGPNSEIAAIGGYDSDGGGEIDITAGTAVVLGNDLKVGGLDGGFTEVRAATTVTMQGVDASGGGDAGSGGCVDVIGGLGVQVLGEIVANGASGEFMTGGCGGLICLDGAYGNLTIGPNGAVNADGASPDGGGGQVALLAQGNIIINGDLIAIGPDGETCGGDLCIDAGLDLTVNNGALINGSGGDSGGEVELIAGRNITVNAPIDARGRQQGSLGGDIALRGGLFGSGSVTVSTQLNATSLPSCSVELGCGQAGIIELTGCNVTVSPGASLLAGGPDAGENLLTAREQLTVRGTLNANRTVPTGAIGSNRFTHPQGKPPVLQGNPNPAAIVQARPVCTDDQPTMPPCLDPCPVCGNGAIEFPETCDLGGMPPMSCSGCTLHCQIEDCDDGLTCTADSCGPALGCRHQVTPVCTEPPTPTRTVTQTRTVTATPTITLTPTITATPSLTPTATTKPTQTPTATTTETATSSPTPSATPTATATATVTQTPTATDTATASPTATATATPTATPSASATPTATPSRTSSATPSATAVDTATATPLDTATATPVDTPTPSPQATATTGTPACRGDCNGNGRVTVNELIVGVNIALGTAPASDCTAIDSNGNGVVSINELIAAVNVALNGCPT
ncbi:MAG: hypothetical protein ACRERC_17750 [Candidatus Binatia bacterium]